MADRGDADLIERQHDPIYAGGINGSAAVAGADREGPQIIAGNCVSCAGGQSVWLQAGVRKHRSALCKSAHTWRFEFVRVSHGAGSGVGCLQIATS